MPDIVFIFIYSGGDRALDDASVDADADRSKDTLPFRLGDGDGEASAPAK